MRSAFPGFPREAIEFFRGLARNNNREWFLPRKAIFEDKVKQPMRELVSEYRGNAFRARYGNCSASSDPASQSRFAGPLANGAVTRSVTKLSHYRHKIGDDRSVPHMSAFLIVVLVGLVLLVAYHTGTYGRRGRRWGG
jgi:hypothetical protein